MTDMCQSNNSLLYVCACDDHMTYMWVHKHPLSTFVCSTASVLQFVLHWFGEVSEHLGVCQV